MSDIEDRRDDLDIAKGLFKTQMNYYLHNESLGFVIDENIRLTHDKSKATAYPSWSSAQDVLERIKPNLFNTDFKILMSAVEDK